MSRVITFSRTFPKYHYKAGQPTFFVEKIWDATALPYVGDLHGLATEMINFMRRGSDQIWPKLHTIRAGHRWSLGDTFSPRVWSGKPYNSKQIIIAPDIEIVKIWDFEIDNGAIVINGDYEFWGGEMSDHDLLAEIAKNDGLDSTDLLDWFKYPDPFDGQIICWNENINY